MSWRANRQPCRACSKPSVRQTPARGFPTGTGPWPWRRRSAAARLHRQARSWRTAAEDRRRNPFLPAASRIEIGDGAGKGKVERPTRTIDGRISIDCRGKIVGDVEFGGLECPRRSRPRRIRPPPSGRSVAASASMPPAARVALMLRPALLPMPNAGSVGVSSRCRKARQRQPARRPVEARDPPALPVGAQDAVRQTVHQPRKRRRSASRLHLCA